MAAIDPRKMITCPYNMAHQIEHYRMQIHLDKCRKQHLDCKKVSCPFDARHIINEAELDYHVTTCPKRHMFDRQRFIVDDSAEFQPAVEEPPTVIMATEENWDADNFESYQPDLSKNHVIKKIKGATPSERRKARMEGVKNYRPPVEN